MLRTTDLKPGQASHEFFYAKEEKLCSYAYKHTNGTLYTCTKKSYKACIQARKDWEGSL